MLCLRLIKVAGRFLSLGALLGAAAGATAIAQEPHNDAFVQSPWPSYHQGPWRQASSPFAGPRSGEPDVQISRFKDEGGHSFGTSPWHYLSDQGYANSPTARTLWGVSLKHVYKYELDGDVFRLADSRRINHLPISIGWNFMALRDGRVVVGNTNGLRLGPEPECRGSHPSLLVYRDGEESGSPIRCVGKFEFSPDVLEPACGFRKPAALSTPIANDVLFDGSIATRIVRKVNGDRETYLAVLDNGLTRIKAYARVASGRPSNQSPMERGAGDSTTQYVPFDDQMVAVHYDPRSNRITLRGSMPIAFRGRTGTTPTIVEAGERRFVVAVDARCAVEDVRTGAIRCDRQDRSASRLVAFPLPLGSAPPLISELPDFIDTVENSPAALGDAIFIANYSGYTPDGPKDGERDRATGIAKMQWDDAAGNFVLAWARSDLQISGVPTVSAASGLVYGSGSEPDRQTYFYGLQLSDGAIGLRVLIGPSYEDRGTAGIFDAGNNTVIADDGSAIFPGGESLVRIRDRER